MKHILLACFGGFSTSMLVNKMREAAKEKHVDVEIKAVGESVIAENINEADCLLLGPQAGYLLDELQEIYQGFPIEVIEPMLYGSMNGDKVLNLAFSIMEGNEK